jgi:hypothetical protein
VSVLGLLQHPLPPVAGFSPSSTGSFFDNNPPNVTDNNVIFNIPIPPAISVITLDKAFPKAVQNGRQSVKCPHIVSTEGKTYPLWIIPLWKTLSRIHVIRQAWRTAQDNLLQNGQLWKEKGELDAAKVVEEVFHALSTLTWDENLQGFSPNATDSLENLTAYASTNWLNGEHANQMLDLLKIDIEQAGLSAIEVANTYFYAKISQGYEDVEKYTSHSSFRVYRHMGHMLATGALDLLAFLANLNQNHWVAVVLDFKNGIIWYGDSLGEKIPSSMEKNLKWWTKFHSGKDFTVKKLIITIQKDSFLCCLLAWNALCVFIFPKTAHFIPAERVAEGRLKMLLQIIYQHQARDDVRNTLHRHSVFIYLTTLQLPENLEDEYAKDVNMADNDLEEEDSLMSQENDSDDFNPDEAMEINSDFGDEHFGSANQPKIARSSSFDSPLAPASTAVRMPPLTPTRHITPARAMEINSDFGDEHFGSANQPKITRSSSLDSPPASTAVRMPPLTPTRDITPASTEESLKKKKATSAIHKGLSMVKNTQQSRGLFKYFGECSKEQYLVDVERETEKSKLMMDQQAYAMEEANQIKKVNIRKRAQERKQKSRMLKKKSEIQMGLRSPGGTKRRVCPLTLLPYNQIKITKRSSK